MKILIIGGGGREHALAWKLAQSSKVSQIICAPGNPGMAAFGQCHAIAADDLPNLLNLAQKEKADLTVVGPEMPLCMGIVDLFQQHGLLAAGPDAYAAQLEGSKAFAKKAMTRFGVPTADYKIFHSHDQALQYVNKQQRPLVIKADGLAAGKGVFLCKTRDDAAGALHDIMTAQIFGDAGKSVIIEEWLHGEEASFLVFSDGVRVLPLPSCQDHKALGDGDTGPNTGGMGAYSPAPVLNEQLLEKALRQAIYPVINGLAREGHRFKGILYAGLMISPAGDINVLEYNVRFGDPECQPLLMRLNSDLAEILLAIAKGDLAQIAAPVWSPEASVCVVAASQGYPGAYDKGQVISGLDDAHNSAVQIFHAGTASRRNQIVANGGRVLGVCAKSPNLGQAVSLAYEAIGKIKFDGMYYRRDIAHRALNKAQREVQVALIMGSTSDWDAMQGAKEVLCDLGIGCESKVLSAHRTPDETLQYVRTASQRGVKVIIAGAGWAAHLAGTAAANTLLPVIGVPLDSSPLAGIDALLATVQMPPGIPVATVAIGAGGARNAAFLAAQILALNNRQLTQKLQKLRADARRKILDAPALD